MPAVQLNPELPTLYLDWSHLCCASEASLQHSSPWSRLWELLNVGRANICASSVHLLELMSWADEGRALRVAQAMDQLPLVWTESTAEHIEIAEAKSALLRSLGADVPPYSPFHAGFVSLMAHGLSPASTPGMLARPSVIAFFEDNRGRGVDPLRASSILLARDVAGDRSRAIADGCTDDELQCMFAEAGPHRASTVMTMADSELRRADAYRKVGLGRPPASDVRDATAKLVADPHALPALHVTSATLNAFAMRIKNQRPTSKGFGDHRSVWFDLAHCGAGAAYCDVFTCDRPTAQDLGNVRERMGRQRQLDQHAVGGAERFVEGIERQLDAWSGEAPLT